MGSIVVQHQMDVEFSIDGLIDPFQKAEKFLMAVPWLTPADHGPFQNFSAANKVVRSVPLVIVRLPAPANRAAVEERVGYGPEPESGFSRPR